MNIKVKIEPEIIENIKEYLYSFLSMEHYESTYNLYINKLYNIFKSGIITIDDSNKNLMTLEEIKITTSRNFNTAVLIFKNKGKIVQQEWKLGRLINLILEKKIKSFVPDEILDHLVGIVSGITGFEKWMKNNNLRIEIGRNFEYCYNTNNYIQKTGSLGHSCMNDKLNVISFYNYLSSVKIISIVNSSSRIYGRCLLWETNKGLYADRSYMIIDILKYGFYKYLKKNYNVKYSYIDYISNDITMCISEPIENIKQAFTKDNLKEVPYTDTFDDAVITSNIIKICSYIEDSDVIPIEMLPNIFRSSNDNDNDNDNDNNNDSGNNKYKYKIFKK